MVQKKKSSQRWLREHFSDPYVKQAHQEGLRSRAAFKLDELQERYRLFKPGMTVIELGAAPGGWSQMLVKWVGKKGQVIALDILPMEPLPGIEFIQGDFTNESVLAELTSKIGQSRVDWVVSDMAPNLSGIDSVDRSRSILLAELALELAQNVLSEGGGFLIKMFQGAGFDEYLKELRTYFAKVQIRKPKASRDRSREVYLLANTFRQKS